MWIFFLTFSEKIVFWWCEMPKYQIWCIFIFYVNRYVSAIFRENCLLVAWNAKISNLEAVELFSVLRFSPSRFARNLFKKSLRLLHYKVIFLLLCFGLFLIYRDKWFHFSIDFFSILHSIYLFLFHFVTSLWIHCFCSFYCAWMSAFEFFQLYNNYLFYIYFFFVSRYQQILHYHMDHDKYDNILDVCKRYGWVMKLS